MSGGLVSYTASCTWTNCCGRFKVCANLAIMCPLLYGTEIISPENSIATIHSDGGYPFVLQLLLHAGGKTPLRGTAALPALEKALG